MDGSRIRPALRACAVALFSVDLRSLALFRVGAALLILIDLAQRSPLLAANYTDAGAHPREAVLPYLVPGLLPSLHMLAGSARAQAALFALAALVALLLSVGYRTRLATAVSWWLLDSLHTRHGLVLDGGDHLLRYLLFWSLFLPLGARWSLDARRRGRPPPRSFVCTPASAALLLQVGCMFFMTGLLKTGPEWADGSALEYALSRKWWILPFGAWLLAHPPLPQWITPMVRWFEMLGPLALFIPVFTDRIRLCMVPAFWGFLAGLGLGLQLNLFPWTSGLGLLPFVPPLAWDVLGRRFPRLRALPSTPASDRPSRVRRLGTLVVNSGVLALLLVVLGLNAAAAGLRRLPSGPLKRVAKAFHLDEGGWYMYAPSPRHIDAWFEHRGRLANGALVDLDRATVPAAWSSQVEQAWEDYRFKYYLQKLADPRWEPLTRPYALWLCRQWNADRQGGTRLDTLEVFAVIQPISLGEEPEAPPEVQPLVGVVCPAG
jgi:hypothetical protein